MGDVLIAIVCGSAGAAIFAGIFRLIEWALNRNAKKEDDAQAAFLTSCQMRGEVLDNVQHQVGALLSATMFLSYDRIRHLCEVYIARGQITPTELKILTDMHRCYHDDLNGNGFLDALMEQVHQLPIVAERR